MKKRNEIKNYKSKHELDLEKIINEYSGYIYKIIENVNNPYLSNEDKEEIVADTFFILWKNREKLDDNKILSSYIAGIVRNLIKEKSRVIDIHYHIQDHENSISDKKDIDMLYEQRETTRLIKEIVQQMKEEDIIIFKLYYYASKKIKEIAQMLNISEFNVKTRLYRIRKRIKQNLEKGGYSDE